MKDILTAFLTSWTFPTSIIGIVFLILTKGAWNKVVTEGALHVKHKYFSFNRKGEDQQKNITPKRSQANAKLHALYKKLGVKKVDDIYLLHESNKKVIEESRVQRDTLFGLWKYYMFSFLNLNLVARSKLALLWLNNNPKSTKEIICANIIFPENFENKELEEEAVLNVLLQHSLIEKDAQDLYTITNIGIDFLKYIGFLK